MIILEWDDEYPDEDYYDDGSDDIDLDFDDEIELIDNWLENLSREEVIDLIKELDEDKFDKWLQDEDINDIETSELKSFLRDFDNKDLLDYVGDDAISDKKHELAKDAKEYRDEIDALNRDYYRSRL